MITIEQIRAARGLLNWTQRDLAEAAGLSVRALNMIELGQTVPRNETLQHLCAALEAHQVSFSADHGVRLLKDRLEIEKFSGTSAKEILIEDILKQTRWRPGNVHYAGPDEEEFTKIDRRLIDKFYREMHARGLKEKILMPRGNILLISRPSCYRWIEMEAIGHVAFSVYADTVVFLTGERGEQLVFIRNQMMAEYFLKHFKAMWKRADPLPFQKFLKDMEDKTVWTCARAENLRERLKNMTNL